MRKALAGSIVATAVVTLLMQSDLFVGSMMQGRTRATGHLQRITFTNGHPIQRETILTDLHQRVRDVRLRPDGLLYVLTDEDPGALLRIEPQ